MTTAPNFIPAADPTALSTRCAAALMAASDLMQSMTEDLPDDKRAALLGLLDGGGRVGLELTVDKHAANRVSLVAIEREGARHTLATVQTVAQTRMQ